MLKLTKMKPAWIVFCNEIAITGDYKKAYSKAFPFAKGESIRVLGSRLLRKEMIQDYINKHSTSILKADIAERAKIKAIEDLKDKIVGNTLSRISKLELLSKIANGAIEIPKKRIVWDKEKKKNVTITIMESPSAIERLRAIEIDNKMCGDYGIDKVAETEMSEIREQTDDSPPLDTAQIVEALSHLRAVK